MRPAPNFSKSTYTASWQMNKNFFKTQWKKSVNQEFYIQPSYPSTIEAIEKNKFQHTRTKGMLHISVFPDESPRG